MHMDGIANRTERAAVGMLQLRQPRVSSTDCAAAILAAPADLFLEHGYGGVAIDDIIVVTGGSKREIAFLRRLLEVRDDAQEHRTLAGHWQPVVLQPLTAGAFGLTASH